MKLENIERYVKKGYELVVKPRDSRFHAMVWLGTVDSSHNYLAPTLDDALVRLDHYLAQRDAQRTTA